MFEMKFFWRRRQPDIVLTGKTLNEAADFLKPYGAEDWCHILLATELALGGLAGKRVLELGYGKPLLRGAVEVKGGSWTGLDVVDPKKLDDPRCCRQGDLMKVPLAKGEAYDAIISRFVFECDQITDTNIPLFVQREALREGMQMYRESGRQHYRMVNDRIRRHGTSEIDEQLLACFSPQAYKNSKKLMGVYDKIVAALLGEYQGHLSDDGVFISQFHGIPGLLPDDFARAKMSVQWLHAPVIKKEVVGRHIESESVTWLVVARKR